MKKVVLMLITAVLLTGCMKSNTDNLKSFKDYNSKKESYELKGTMKLVSNEDEFTYDLTVGVENQENYKVSLLNTISNHEQVILKNSQGVFVVTPNLNKSFKFQSEWPSNSSQAYLLESLVQDINDDGNATIKEENDLYVIESKVNYPNNAKLVSERITTDKKYNVKNVSVLDEDGNTVLEVKISDINYSPRFNDEYFSLDTYKVTDKEETTKKQSDKESTTKNTTTTTTAQNGETTTQSTTSTSQKTEDCISTCDDKNSGNQADNDACKKQCTTQSTSNILEDIIYPLYVPTDTYLSSKDTVSTDNGNRVILTFAGVDPFILVEEASVRNDEMEIVPVSGEPLLMGSTIGALTSNSIYWTNNGIDYYLTSNTLDSKEMMTIAESITNSSSLVAKTK